METKSHKRSSRCKRLHNYIRKTNLFDHEDSIPLVDQLLATRIFAFLFSTTLTILVAFTAVSVRARSVTIPSPSPGVFRQLSSRYPGTLSCPCSRTAIRHDAFLAFDPRYHPICTSRLVQHSFISSLSNINTSDYHHSDYRVMGASHFQLLAVLCRTVEQMVLDSLRELAEAHITTTEVLFLDAFDAQAQQLSRQLQTTATANMKHMSDFLWLNIFQNGIFSGLRTNYHIQNIPGSGKDTYLTAKYATADDTCSCRTSTTCGHRAQFYNFTGYRLLNNALTGKTHTIAQMKPLFPMPGMMTGCFPYSSLLQSTLECFYNQSCIGRVRPLMPAFATSSPLSPSRFPPNATVQRLFDELFIESWNDQTNFTGYFHVCSPHSCTYSYDGRFNWLYTVVTLIGLFGGLRMVTLFSAPLVVKVIRRLQGVKCRFDRTQTPTDANRREFLSLRCYVRQRFTLASSVEKSTCFYYQ